MKIVRPGNTEMHLIIAQFCENYCSNLNSYELNEIKRIKMQYTDWIYKTAGYYDKSVLQKKYYSFADDYTDNLKIYIEKMTESLKNCQVCALLWISSNNILFKYIPLFEQIYNTKCVNHGANAASTIPYIINKKVLVISPFKELIDQQIISGNLKKIQPNLESSTFITFKFPYTFLNNGPHNNSLETLEEIKKDLKNNYNDFDIAILSCGSYGSFLVDFIDTEFKKDAVYVGGQLPLIFGIIGKRDKWAINGFYKGDTTYLIDGVPEKYRPEGWEKIEGGCYW